MLWNCAQKDGSFPLYENLTARKPLASPRDVLLFAADQVHGIKTDWVAYFACSVFWRAASTQWQNHPYRLELGPHQERLKRYLLGKTQFPDHAALRVIIASPPVAKLLALFPRSHRLGGMNSVTFLIPGMIFTLILARHIPEGLKRLAFMPREKVIGVSDRMYLESLQVVADGVRDAEPKGYLKDFFNGPDPRSRGD